MKSIKDILNEIKSKDSGKYLSQEWQLFAYELAVWLGDKKRISLYMKLAKNEKREVIQRAWDFVKEANHPKSRAGLFHWKLKEIRMALKAEEAKKKDDIEGQKEGA